MRAVTPSRTNGDGRSQVNGSTGTRPRTLLSSLAAVMAGITVLAGCSMSPNRSSHKTARRPASTTTIAPASTTTTPPVTYRVKRGEALGTIAARFHVSIDTIVSANHLADPNHIAEGQLLVIPPAPPLVLVVTPPEGAAGRGFQLRLTGAKSGEIITFEIDSPTTKFTGPPHVATTDGAAGGTYQTSPSSPIGTYNVIASGNQGTRAQASFRVVPSTSTQT